MRPRIIALVMGVAVLGAAMPAQAEPPPPRLRAKSQGLASVRLQLDSRLGKERAASVLELERGGDDGIFSPLVSIPAPRRRLAISDTPPARGRWWYRARVAAPSGVSLWAAPVAVTVEPAPGEPTLGAGQSECPLGYTDRVLALVNADRRQVGLAPLAAHPLLAKAARRRVVDMAAARSLSHDGWSDTIAATGYHASALGENIALGYTSPETVTAAWLASSGHRANIERTSFAETGVGCVRDDTGRSWWAQDFGG